MSVPQNPYIRTGPETDVVGSSAKGGSGDTFAPYSKNPGMRVRMQRDRQLTRQGILEQELVLPAPPLDQFQRSLTYAWEDYQTISAGQFSRPSGMTLQTLSFDTILLADDYSWAFYNPLRTRGWDAHDQARQLGAILRSGTPFMFIVEQASWKANGTALDFGLVPVLKFLATLRGLTDTNKSGEPEVEYVNLSITEFRSPGAQQKALGKAGASGSSGSSIGGNGSGKGGANSPNLPASVPMKNFQSSPKPSVNTLHDLATLYYGSASKWTKIKESNPWLGNVTADHDLGTWDTNELKAAGKANRRLTIPVLAAGG